MKNSGQERALMNFVRPSKCEAAYKKVSVLFSKKNSGAGYDNAKML
jgi:hypothetical protein